MEKQTASRIITSTAIVGGVALAFLLRWLTVWIFDVIILAVMAVAVWDVMRARKTEKQGVRDYYVYVYLAVAYLVFLFGILVKPTFSFWLHIIMQAVLLAIFCLYVYMMNVSDKNFIKQANLKKSSPSKEGMRSVGKYLGLVVYPAILIFTLIPLNHIDAFTVVTDSVGATLSTNIGLFALLLVFAVSCLTDTAAWLVGRTFKGPKLLSEKHRYISPNKTWSGAIGGLFGGVIGALTVLWACTYNAGLAEFLTQKIGWAGAVKWVVVGIGILGSIATQAGDIYASYLKRKVGIKDFGNYLPGHGGAMDRLDGISFNALLIFISMLILVFIC